MQKSIETPSWDYLDFAIDDDGNVVATLRGGLPDPHKITDQVATVIVRHPLFAAAMKHVIANATGRLRKAFERTMRGDRQITLKFETSPTIHDH